MPSLLLALVAPAQSWGTASRFGLRDAGTEPSKSGVVGLLCCALGRHRDEPIDDLASLRMGVRVDAEGVVQSDYHTALGAIRADGKANPHAVESRRYFLADAAFLVALEGDTQLVEDLNRALQTPCWPLYLGRKSFAPAGPVERGISSGGIEVALATGVWTDPSRARTESLKTRVAAHGTVMLRTVVETSLAEASSFIDDQPVSFEPRRFRRRGLRVGSVPATLNMLSPAAASE